MIRTRRRHADFTPSFATTVVTQVTSRELARKRNKGKDPQYKMRTASLAARNHGVKARPMSTASKPSAQELASSD